VNCDNENQRGNKKPKLSIFTFHILRQLFNQSNSIFTIEYLNSNLVVITFLLYSMYALYI